MADDKRGGLWIPQEILDDWMLGANLKLVYAVMLRAADADGICRLSGSRIGKICGMTATAASQNRLKLVNIGYLDKVVNTSGNFIVLKHLEVRSE